MKKRVFIGLYNANGTSAIVYSEGGKVKEFGSYQQAEEFILRNNLGMYASPIEVYES